MHYELKITGSYTGDKQNFINANNGYTQLTSAVRRLERKIKGESVIPQNLERLTFAIYVEETHIKTPSLSHLGCLAITNDAAQSIAPCILFFVGKQAQIPPGQQKAACAAVLAVRGELGW